jgi:hypothetical protein
MVVNDNAYLLDKRAALKFIASTLAPAQQALEHGLRTRRITVLLAVRGGPITRTCSWATAASTISSANCSRPTKPSVVTRTAWCICEAEPFIGVSNCEIGEIYLLVGLTPQTTQVFFDTWDKVHHLRRMAAPFTPSAFYAF